MNQLSRLLIPALLACTCAIAPGAAESSRPQPPKGFYLLSSRHTPIERLTFEPFLSGYALRIGWNELEPKEGDYDFSQILHTIEFLQKKNLRLTLEVFSSRPPEYVVKQASGTFETRNGPAPLPWDETAQVRWLALLQALAALPTPDGASGYLIPLFEHPTLTAVDSPVVGLQAIRDIRHDLVKHPQYTREKFISAVEKSVRSSREAFPHDYGFLAFFRMDDANRHQPLDAAIFDRIEAQFMGPSGPGLGLFQELWSDQGPTPRLGAFLNRVRAPDAVLLQSLTSWKRPFTDARKVASGNPDKAIATALENYNCHYFELYYDDTRAADLQPVFTRWASRLAE